MKRERKEEISLALAKAMIGMTVELFRNSITDANSLDVLLESGGDLYSRIEVAQNEVLTGNVSALAHVILPDKNPALMISLDLFSRLSNSLRYIGPELKKYILIEESDWDWLSELGY
jgi:hypothetical protein